MHLWFKFFLLITKWKTLLLNSSSHSNKISLKFCVHVNLYLAKAHIIYIRHFKFKFSPLCNLSAYKWAHFHVDIFPKYVILKFDRWLFCVHKIGLSLRAAYRHLKHFLSSLAVELRMECVDFFNPLFIRINLFHYTQRWQKKIVLPDG